MGDLNITIILAQVVNFLILFLLFKKFISDKLTSTIAERRGLMKKLENAESEYKEKIQKAEDEKEHIMNLARKTAHNMMIEVESLANKKSVDIILRAEGKANQVLEGGKRELEKERLRMLAQMKSKIIDIALKLNEKLFEDVNVERDYMEKELKKIK